jgi:predicted ATP-grasp superfamily ATP-dependent carboligase
LALPGFAGLARFVNHVPVPSPVEKIRLQTGSRAVVLDGNQRSALTAVRSLGQRGVDVVVAETGTAVLAAASRFCKARLSYPDPTRAPERFTAWLEDLNARFPNAVLLPMTDITVPLVLQAAPRLPLLHTALPSFEAYETVSDKYRLFLLARQAGVHVPETAIVSKATRGELASRTFSYPVVVKPRRSAMRIGSNMAKRTVRYARNAADLNRVVGEMLIDDADELLLQDFIEGHGAGVFGLYQQGAPVFFFAHRRIREKPPSGGVSVLCESVPLPEEGLASARKILDPLGWHGVAMVEFKIDPAGRAWLIEINARFWGSLQLAVDSGADFPWALYQLARGAPVEAPDGYTVGNRLRWWLGDLDNLYARLTDRRWTPTAWQKLSALAEFLPPWQPRTRYEFLRWSDPAPSFAAFRQYLASTFRGR